MFRYLLLMSAFVCSAQAYAQLHDNAYRNANNPLYWQNRKPDGAYWQQDVHYKITANVNEETNVIEGRESLTYWNNSPDTLPYVYFHLYQNAFIKGSYLHHLEEANKVSAKLGGYEAQGKGIVVSNIHVNGVDARTELDNTIMKVWLPQPLVPGGKITIDMEFDTYYDKGSTRRRMQMWDAWGFTHYNGCQWYPKMSVYDRRNGWDTYQHLNREFYGDFGFFDVTLNFASNYIVEATGVLQNRKEALPDTLMQKIDIKNFAKKPWNEPPSIIIPYKKGERKEWHYVANNVHDFAFVADPSYRISTTTWNGVECVGIVQEPHAAGWQNSAEYTAKVIKTFSESIGMYQYPKMVAADARDGMEYPMLTMDNGSNPGYHGLLVHEIGHNWFYGMVGSNETYRAAMDEGFTQFLTVWGLRRIDGDRYTAGSNISIWNKKIAEAGSVLDKNTLTPYTFDALNQKETQINTHSDDFNSGLGHEGGYRSVYYKTAAMLYNLEYVLGDSLFEAAMQHYFHQWRFVHPYFEDFCMSMTQFTKTDLSWFFDEWYGTTKTIDYGIGRIKRTSGDNYAIKFKRKSGMQMPIDFTVTARDGHRQNYYIPNTWFEKSTGATTLPKWAGWGKLVDDYTAHVTVPSGIRDVQIDTTYRLADIALVDNYKRKGLGISPVVKTKLDWGNALWDRRHYRLYIRPDLWWNAVDGVKAGVHFEGDYHYTLYKVDGTIWWNTHLGQENAYKVLSGQGMYARYVPVNYTFNYLSPITRNMPKVQLQLNSRLLDGLWYHKAGLNWHVDEKNTISLHAQTMWRQTPADLDYLLYPMEWSSTSNKLNTSLNAAWTHNYEYVRGTGSYTFSLRAPFMNGNNTAAFDYSYAQLEAINNNNMGKLVVRTRFFGRYGRGNNLPSESMLFLAGANPEELMEDKFTRSAGFVPNNWRTYSFTDINHFQQGGGLNLRGYAGYIPVDGSSFAYKGRSGVAGNIEVDVDKYIPLHPRFTRNWLQVNLYAFADGGLIELVNATPTYPFTVTPAHDEWSNFRMDAGIGTAFTIKQWRIFEKANPLTLRFDMPLFLSNPPGTTSNFAFRYVIGVNRSF